MKTITFKTDKSGITIRIPRTLLNHIAKHHPSGIVVTDPHSLHEHISHELDNNTGYDADTGLTGFQQLIDDSIEACAENGESADFKD